MIVENKPEKKDLKATQEDKEDLMGSSMLGLSGFHICNLCDKEAVPSFFKKKRTKKAVLVQG